MRSCYLVPGILSITRVISGVYSAPSAASNILEQLRKVPEGWTLVGTPEPERLLHLRITVQSPNQAQFEQTVLDISTPDHPSYGQHMKHHEIKAMLRPTAAATASIIEWLHFAGVPRTNIGDEGEWINFVTTVRQAEKLLDTEFYWFRNRHNNAERIRTLQYSVPQPLHQYIDMIQPTTRFGQIRPERSTIYDVKAIAEVNSMSRLLGNDKALNAMACNSTITPACLRALYDVGNFTADPANGNKLGIAGYLEEIAQLDDLKTFTKLYTPRADKGNLTIATIHGGAATQGNNLTFSIEANLDVQYSLSLSYPTPSIFYNTGGRGPLVPDLLQPNQSQNSNEPYLDFLNYILKLPDNKLPRTLTTSYGEEEQSVPERYSRIVCAMFAQLGARGVSVLFSSGDSGPGTICLTNDGRNTTRFQANFPGACPWVTSVGGTIHVEPEEAIFFSSGGFSDRFKRPSYQETAVSDYLKGLGHRFSGLFNPQGRGFPDVAAQAFNYRVINHGQEILVSGTR